MPLVIIPLFISKILGLEQIFLQLINERSKLRFSVTVSFGHSRRYQLYLLCSMGNSNVLFSVPFINVVALFDLHNPKRGDTETTFRGKLGNVAAIRLFELICN